MFDKKGVLFWPVGTGDSTTFIVEPEEVVLQVDLRHTADSEDEQTEGAPIVDKLIEYLPEKDGRPYLSAFALTHPDKDHVQGFAQLLERVDIGELWFSPFIFRESEDEGLCDDAKAFREEAHRRVDATIAAGGDPGAGDRVRLIGHDPLLEEEHYTGFPTAFLTIPGNSVTMLDGEERPGALKIFIHGPFKQEEMEGDRNDTSVVMQVVLGDDPAAGGVLLFGDHKYPTMRKVINVTRDHKNEEFLAWQILLAPHHCSKSVMYQDVDGKTSVMQDLLDDLDGFQVGDGIVVASCASIPASNSVGDNPPHAKAKKRYEEIARGGFLCTHDDGEHAEPLRFELVDGKLIYAGAASTAKTEAKGVGKVAAAVGSARGGAAPPAEKVGFGA